MQFSLFKDARYFQVLFQSLFLLYGLVYLHWSAEWWLYTTYFITAISTQLLCELCLVKKTCHTTGLWQRFSRGFPSVLITVFGLSLLLKTNFVSTAVLASFVSIISKYIVRINGKHIFNPSALGIVSTLMFSNNAWISPAQWGSNMVILFGTLSLGFIVVTRVQKLDVSISFLGTFAALLFARQIIYLGWPLDYFVQSVSTGSLLLFSFFMITDPKTTPDHTVIRILWSMLISVIAFYLTAFKFINGAPLFVLVCAQPLVPILDKMFQAKKFEWHPPIPYSSKEKAFLKAVYHNQSL